MSGTLQQFAAAVPCTQMTAATWWPHISSACERWGIAMPIQVAAFVASCAHESGRFSRFEERLNYGAQGLANTWPSRYAVDRRTRPLVPNDLARALSRKPVAIANNVYAGRMGNGPPESGDGWRHRGRGPIQITGADNYRAYFEAAGLPKGSDPDLLLDPHHGADAAGWFWSQRGCNELAAQGKFREACIALNGGLVGYEDGNDEGIDDRVEHYDLACRVYGVRP